MVADREGSLMSEPGMKYDGEKPRWDLVPFGAVERIVDVLTYGAKKYAPNNWQKVEPVDRYFAAAMRHLSAYRQGEKIDPESGLPYLAHAACSLIFLIWFDEQEGA